MSELSNDAKSVMGHIFCGPMGGEIFRLSFQMHQSKPTARMKAALDELVSGKFLTRRKINMAGGVEYRLAPNPDIEKWRAWGKRHRPAEIQIAEPIEHPQPEDAA